jgi:hypothetical protein
MSEDKNNQSSKINMTKKEVEEFYNLITKTKSTPEKIYELAQNCMKWKSDGHDLNEVIGCDSVIIPVIEQVIEQKKNLYSKALEVKKYEEEEGCKVVWYTYYTEPVGLINTHDTNLDLNTINSRIFFLTKLGESYNSMYKTLPHIKDKPKVDSFIDSLRVILEKLQKSTPEEIYELAQNCMKRKSDGHDLKKVIGCDSVIIPVIEQVIKQNENLYSKAPQPENLKKILKKDETDHGPQLVWDTFYFYPVNRINTNDTSLDLNTITSRKKFLTKLGESYASMYQTLQDIPDKPKVDSFIDSLRVNFEKLQNKLPDKTNESSFEKVLEEYNKNKQSAGKKNKTRRRHSLRRSQKKKSTKKSKKRRL